MIGNWQHQNLPEPKRYFDYSISFLKAGIEFCSKMTTALDEQNWANASAVMLLEAHAIELFLKGAILAKVPDQKWNGNSGHDLNSLCEQYFNLYDADLSRFQIPLVGTEYIGFTKEEIIELQKREKSQVPSIRFRYPVDKNRGEWNGVHGFIPEQTLKSMKALLADIVLISNTIYPPLA